jgi:hypothetical protein
LRVGALRAFIISKKIKNLDPPPAVSTKVTTPKRGNTNKTNLQNLCITLREFISSSNMFSTLKTKYQ